LATGVVVIAAGIGLWGWQGGAWLEGRAGEALGTFRADVERQGGSVRHGQPTADPWRLRVLVPEPVVSAPDGRRLQAERLVVSLAPWDSSPGLRLEQVSAEVDGLRLRANALGGRPDVAGSEGVLRQAWARDVLIERPAPGRGMASITAVEVRADRLSRIGGAEGVVAEAVEIRQPGQDLHPGGVTGMARIEATRLGGEAPRTGSVRIEARDAVLRGAAGQVSAARVLLEGSAAMERIEGALTVEGGRLPAPSPSGRSERFAARTTWQMEGRGLDLGMSMSIDGMASAKASVALRDLPAIFFPVSGDAVAPEARLPAMLAFSEATLASASIEVRDLGGLSALLAADGAGLRRWAETEGRAPARGMPPADQAVRAAVADFVRAPGGRTLTVSATPPRPMTLEDLGRRAPFLLLGAGAGPLGLTAQVR
jgi:hypothetical protein